MRDAGTRSPSGAPSSPACRAPRQRGAHAGRAGRAGGPNARRARRGAPAAFAQQHRGAGGARLQPDVDEAALAPQRVLLGEGRVVRAGEHHFFFFASRFVARRVVVAALVAQRGLAHGVGGRRRGGRLGLARVARALAQRSHGAWRSATPLGGGGAQGSVV